MTDRAATSTSDLDPFDALAEAVKAGDTGRASDLLLRRPELASRLNEPMPGGAFGTPVIGPAVQHNNLEMIDLLLRHGADINARSHWWAGGCGVLDLCDPSLAPALIERGARVDAHAAARLGMLGRLDALVTENPHLVHARGGDGQTPLHFASTIEIADYLLHHGADIDARDVDHESTAAQYMVRDRQGVALVLVQRGCHTDILMAAALGDIDLVRGYLDSDAGTVRTRVSNAYFPMQDPRAGGTIYIWTLGGNKSAHVVAHDFGHENVLQLLMDRSPDELKLAVACELGDEDLVNSLITERPNLAQSLLDDDRRKLVDAAESDNAAAVSLMLAAGWPTDVRGNLEATALHFAAWHGNADVVRDLLRRGAPVEVRGDRYDLSPLGWALHGSENSWRRTFGDYGVVVEALLAAGARAPELTPDLKASPAARSALARFS
jgi:ankyrin repeat protein